MNYRLISLSDAKDCNDFHNSILKDDRTLDQWNWNFAHLQFGDNLLPFVVAEDNGKIIGTQALIPIKMIDRTGLYWSAKSEETLVDPSYRGKKIFQNMYAILFQYVRDHGLQCVWGFTPATKAFSKLGFKLPTVTSQIAVPFLSSFVNNAMRLQQDRTSPLIATKGRYFYYKMACVFAECLSSYKLSKILRHGQLHRNQKITLKTLKKAPKDSGKIMEDFISCFGGRTIYRNEEYLNWRIFNNPYLTPVFRGVYFNDKLCGWIIYTAGEDNIGYMVDLIVTGKSESVIKEIIKLLIFDAIIILRSIGVSGIRGWHVTEHPFDKLVTSIALSMGFYNLKKGFDVVLYLNRESSRKNALNDINSWYINRIYTEGVIG